MPSTSLTFHQKELSMHFEGFDKDNEMEFIATDKVCDREFIYFLSVSEAKSLHKFLSDHLSDIEK